MSKQVVENLKTKFGDRVEIYEHNDRRAYVTVSRTRTGWRSRAHV